MTCERVKPTNFPKGDWVYYFHPHCYQGKQDRWIKEYLGPYLVVDNTSPVNVTLQAYPRAPKFTVHIDKVKPFTGKTPRSWLEASKEDSRLAEVDNNLPELSSEEDSAEVNAMDH